MALREDYRELLLEAAVLVVSRDGLDHATTKAIAKEAACNEVYINPMIGTGVLEMTEPDNPTSRNNGKSGTRTSKVSL